MAWWLWILLGFGLLAAEMLTPTGFYVFFFGVAALLVGALAWLELGGGAQTEWLLFSVFSVLCLLLLRPRLAGKLGAADGNTPMPEFVGDVAVLAEDLAPGGVAKAELRGTSWNARSHEHRVLPRGSRCRVERVEGLTLWLTAPRETD